jgi:hypothetical protein
MFDGSAASNVELDAVNVLGTWAKKEDPIAQINLTKKDIESLNTGRDLPYVLQDVAGVVSFLMLETALVTPICVSVVRMSRVST